MNHQLENALAGLNGIAPTIWRAAVFEMQLFNVLMGLVGLLMVGGAAVFARGARAASYGDDGALLWGVSAVLALIACVTLAATIPTMFYPEASAARSLLGAR